MELIYRVKLKQTYCVDSILSEISLYAVSIFSSLEEAAPGRGVLSMSDPRHTGEMSVCQLAVSWWNQHIWVSCKQFFYGDEIIKELYFMCVEMLRVKLVRAVNHHFLEERQVCFWPMIGQQMFLSVIAMFVVVFQPQDLPPDYRNSYKDLSSCARI